MNKKTVTEAIGEIENRFIAEAMDYKCERRHIVRNIKKIAAIAATVMVILTVTVSSAAFTGLVDKDAALGSAMEYVAQNAETQDESDLLTKYILAGEAIVELFEEKQVDLGLKNFRAVYSVSFRLGEYTYEVGVDAKTGVVISCDRWIDEWWWQKSRKDEVNVRPTEEISEFLAEYDKFRDEIHVLDLYNIAVGYTGLYTKPVGHNSTEVCKSYDWNQNRMYGFEFEGLPEIYDKYSTWYFEMTHGGYKYELFIDSVTGVVLNCDITEYDEYEGERHLHEPSYEHIGPYQARQIFTEQTGIDYNSEWMSFGVSFYPENRDIIDGSETIENVYGKDFYYVCATTQHTGEKIVCVIDAKTGEVIEMNSSIIERLVVSTEAPDGMISEAAAKAVALEDLGITDRYIKMFTIELKDSESQNASYYEINITDYKDVTYIYKVDAVSGQIIR